MFDSPTAFGDGGSRAVEVENSHSAQARLNQNVCGFTR
jgi:hypothetical protein